jgi:hypothetical protein
MTSAAIIKKLHFFISTTLDRLSMLVTNEKIQFHKMSEIKNNFYRLNKIMAGMVILNAGMSSICE